MEAIDLEAAQKRLEEKRALLKQTDPTPIGSDLGEPEIVKPCKECGADVVVKVTDFYASAKIPVYCPPCIDKREEAHRKEVQREKEAEQERWISKRIQESGIGERFLGMTFLRYKPENKDAEKVRHECIDFVRNFDPESGTNLLLIGSPGTGKNMLAAIIGQEVIKKGFRCMHTTALRCVRKVKDSWKHKDEDEQEVINAFTSPALLIIDEVGVQFGSPTELLYLTEIINDRYEKKRPTILISNLTVKQLEEIIGARIMDRFYEGESKFLVFNWPSYRRK